MARTTGYPKGLEWYAIPNESALDYPDLDSVLAQMATYAERRTSEAQQQLAFYDGIPGTPLHPAETKKSWFIAHKKTVGAVFAAIFVTGLGVLANFATVISFFAKFFGG